MGSSFISTAQSLLDFLSQSYFFLTLKILLGLYAITLFIDIVLLILLRDIREDIKKDLYGTTVVPFISKSSFEKKWRKIEDRLKSENASEYKVAVLEADALTGEMLAEIGYKGDDMSQQISQLALLQAEDARALESAHSIRNRIVFEKDFQIDANEAQELLDIFKNFLKKSDIMNGKS